MSGLKARLVKPTGLEFYDLAIAINTAIWNFVKFEFKNKAAKDAGDKRKDSEKTVSTIPTRYWQTHAVPLVEAGREMIHEITLANSSFPIITEDDLRSRLQIHAAYISWYGFQSHMHAHKALRSANRYYNSLFGGAYVGLHG